jgi:hypothetical protein
MGTAEGSVTLVPAFIPRIRGALKDAPSTPLRTGMPAVRNVLLHVPGKQISISKGFASPGLLRTLKHL